MILYAFLKPPRRANQHKKMLACMHIKSKLNYLFQMPYLSDCGALFNTIKFIPINMINRLLSERHRLLPFLIRHFSRSKEAQLKLSAGAQRALWANKIITQIADAKDQIAMDIANHSLRQLIIQCKNPIMGVAFEDTHRKEVISMFESGIFLDKQVFTQGRVARGQNNDTTFTFCPNLLATRPIFRKLRNQGKYTVFHDAYGISKTISIIMFIELSRHIHKYVYDAVVNKIYDEEEYKMLRQRKYIDKMIKYWYWSIDSNDQLKPGYLQKKIAAQATQLSQEQRLAIKNSKTPQEAIDLVKDFYRKTNISHIPVVDQINRLVSMMRKWNEYEEKNRQNIKGHEDFSTAIIDYNNAVELDKHFKQFISIASRQKSCVLNSSINIEANLLYGKKEVVKQAIKQYGSLSLKLIDNDNEHQKATLSFMKFDYLIKIFQQWGKNDFKHTFWFEFSRLITQTISKDTLTQLRKSFLDHIKSIEIKQYYRFLEINLFLDDKDTIISRIAEIKDPVQQVKQIQMLLSPFDQYCFQKCVQRAKKFFQKKGDTDLKRDFHHAMYVIALKAKLRGQKELIINMTSLNLQIKENKLEPFLFFQSSDHDKELIPFQNVGSKTQKVKILWGTQLFCRILEHILYKSFDYQNLLINQFQKDLLRDKVYLGRFIEALIVHQLKKGCILELLNALKKRKTKKVRGQIVQVRSRVDIDESSFKKDQYQIASVAHFDAFPLKQEQYSNFDFQQSLANLITQCDKLSGNWVSAIPVCGKSSITDEIVKSPNNPSVDFILAKRKDTKNGKKYILNCVDVTISRGSVSGKEKKAKELYKKLLTSNNQNTFQINHIILCPRKSCIGFIKEEKSNLTVIYSNIEIMRFEKSRYPNELVMFEGVQRYFMLETIQLEAEKKQ